MLNLGLRAIAGAWQNSSGLWPSLYIIEHGQLQFRLPSCPQKQYPQSIKVLHLPENFTPSFNPKEVYSIPRSAAPA
jgi:hypothetical protein